MPFNIRLRKADTYQPHYSFFNHLKRAISERIAHEYIEKILVSKLIEDSRNLFIKMHISKAEAPNYDPTHYKDNYLYVLQFFKEYERCNYFINLPTENIQTRRIFLRNDENYLIGFYEEEVNYLAGGEKMMQIRFIIAKTESVVKMLEDNKEMILDYREPVSQISFSTKDDVLKHLKEFTYVFLEDGLRWLSANLGFFALYKYTPDSLYLECEIVGSKSLKVKELTKIEWSRLKEVRELIIEVPVIRPRRIHVFEVKTRDPLDDSSYTPNQKKFIETITRNKTDEFSLYVIYVPMENYIPLKGSFPVRIYELR